MKRLNVRIHQYCYVMKIAIRAYSTFVKMLGKMTLVLFGGRFASIVISKRRTFVEFGLVAGLMNLPCTAMPMMVSVGLNLVLAYGADSGRFAEGETLLGQVSPDGIRSRQAAMMNFVSAIASCKIEEKYI